MSGRLANNEGSASRNIHGYRDSAILQAPEIEEQDQDLADEELDLEVHSACLESPNHSLEHMAICTLLFNG